ncbi:calcium-binding protein [Paracoccus zhejiangensis]|uniref:Calcium-binding protein n=1 Tax=Paracoccus zhejiangensis TaxID=1077935 RepID=A0A2H5F0J5_9RHOB|nr:hypothetical protein [Paracoccus zhejiangensis]AUH65079.1 hypothetical protein CX676_13590 [Paracoccus zhejiangensis]
MNRIDGTNNTISYEAIYGTDASDWIYSYDGFDVVHGGPGKDIYTPGNDGDLKLFRDFQDGSDLIDLSGWGVTSFDQLVITEIDATKIKISTADGSHYVDVSPMYDVGQITVDATDFIYAGTPLHEYSTGFDNVSVTVNEYALHFGNGGTNWLNLGDLVRGAQTRDGGAVVIMDDDALGNGTFTVRGVTQHFFDFQNIRGTNAQDTLVGDQQDNNLAGLGNADEIHGGGGDDRLFGNIGSDTLYGDNGADVLNGGDGYDQMWGGAGADKFVFVSFDTRSDLVRDYEDGIDQLDISQWGADSMDDLTLTDLGAGRVRVALADSSLSFELRDTDRSLHSADLDSSDFIFT